jgi:hypothetical protein
MAAQQIGLGGFPCKPGVFICGKMESFRGCACPALRGSLSPAVLVGIAICSVALARPLSPGRSMPGLSDQVGGMPAGWARPGASPGQCTLTTRCAMDVLGGFPVGMLWLFFSFVLQGFDLPWDGQERPTLEEMDSDKNGRYQCSTSSFAVARLSLSGPSQAFLLGAPSPTQLISLAASISFSSLPFGLMP